MNRRRLSSALDLALCVSVGAFIGMVAAFCGARLNRAQDAALRPALVFPEVIRYTATPDAEEPEPAPAMPNAEDLIDEDFLAALAAVESGGNDAAVNAREDAHGRFQVRAACLADANRILGTAYTLEEMHERDKAERVVRAYLSHYGSRLATPTREALARVWNGGPRGHERAATRDYGARFRALWEARHA